MKEKSLIIVTLAILLLLTACAGNSPYRVTMTDGEWREISHDKCGFVLKNDMLLEADGYIDKIAELTGKTDWSSVYGGGKIEMVFSDGASHVEGGYDSDKNPVAKIYIKKYMAEHDFWPLAHELTHIICPDYSSLSLREGLASYMQDEISGIPAVFNYGIDVHAYARLFTGDAGCAYITNLMGSTDREASVAAADGADRKVFYLCSYSFSRYLIENYGLDAFMRLYDSKNLADDIAEICGMPRAELIGKWKVYLAGYPNAITEKELEKQMLTVFSLHGVEEE